MKECTRLNKHSVKIVLLQQGLLTVDLWAIVILRLLETLVY